MVLLKWHLSRAAKAAALQNMREGMAWEKIHSEWTRKVELLVEERNIILESEKEMSATNLAMLEAEGRVRMEALESKYQEEIALVEGELHKVRSDAPEALKQLESEWEHRYALMRNEKDSQYAGMMEEKDRELESLTTEIGAKQVQHVTALNRAMEDSKRVMIELEAVTREEVQATNEAMREAKEQHTIEVAGLKAMHEKLLEDLRNVHVAERSKIEEVFHPI